MPKKYHLFGNHMNILGLPQNFTEHVSRGAHVTTRGAVAPPVTTRGAVAPPVTTRGAVAPPVTTRGAIAPPAPP